MRRRKLSIGILGITILLIVTAFGCSSGDLKKRIAQRDARITELENELVTLEGDLVAEENKAAALNADLEAALAEYQAKEQVWLEQQGNKSIVTVSDAVLFKSGGHNITEGGQAVIDRISAVAGQHSDKNIMIEGHTDNVPISATYKEKFQSNWELASARACSVLRYMYWKHKIDPGRLSAIGYGEHRPIAANESSEGRAKNRRVVIVISTDPAS